MDNKKLIRKHSKLRRFLMNAGYYSVKGLRIPVIIGLLGICFLASLSLVIIGFVAPEGNEIYDWRGNTERVHTVISALIWGSILLCSGGGGWKIKRAPVGSVLNPLPPAVNEILPDTEILVRASAPTNSATLLRAATANPTDDAPAVLLRAANSETAQ